MHTPVISDEALRERFEILSLLGEGGFGTVYKARQRTTGQEVAIKLARSREQLPNEVQVARFLREMQLCAQLHHPNIVRLIDAGQVQDGRAYTVFEFVPGKNLKQVLAEEGRLEPHEARYLMLQIADALAAAHAQGVVHRDLKPANIMVVSTGARRNALVLDFGISGIVEGSSREELAKITRSYEMIGTPAYSAPEQIRGLPPTPRSDIYSWGLVFLECLTGKPCITGGSFSEVIFQHLKPDPIPLPEALKGHPLGRLLQRAMEKDPEARKLTAHEVLSALEACDLTGLDLKSPHASPQPPGTPPRSPASAADADGETGLSAQAAKTPPPNANLPSQPTKFVGRVKEVAALRELILRDDVRMVTLSGPGGSGKTRLALQVALALQSAFRDGVFAVHLAPVSDPALVIPTIAQVLGVPEIPGRPLTRTMQDMLHGKQLLLLLDNFEQILPAAPMVAELLTACPSLKVLTTSRAILRLRFEREFPVPPLTLPEPEDQASIDRLGGSDAVRLFLDRVHDFAPDFTLTQDNAATVAEICSRLEGLPLAIELAAPRLRVLTPEALLARLGNRLKMLTGGARDLAARQQTLRATIEWSYNLLQPEEQHLFARLGAFVGGCSLADAEAILDPDGSSPISVLDGLASLSAQSLLKQSTTGGELRVRMLETLREYAVERLDASGQGQEIRQRHAAHYLALVEKEGPEVLGRRQRGPAQRLKKEADNIRAALSFSLERGEVEMAGRIFQALVWYWISQGQFLEARGWMERVLARMAGLGRTRVRARALDAAGFLTIFLGDYGGAIPLFEEARSIFLECGGSKLELASSTMGLGVTSGATGSPQGVPLMEQAVVLAREGGDKNLAAVCLIALGENARFMKNHPRAGGFYSESLELLRETGNVFWIGYCLQNLAHVLLHEGQWQRASQLLAEALEIGLEYQYVMVVNLYLAAMAGVGLGRGEPRQAVRLLSLVDTLLKQVGASFQPPDQNEYNRNLELARGQLDEATFQAAWSEGSRLTPEQAIAESLELRP